MELKTFYYFFDEALKEENNDQGLFVSKYVQDEAWQAEGVDDITKRQIALFKIWDAARIKVKALKKKLKLTEHGLADLFHIPFSTVTDWCGERRKCSDYLRILMQRTTGLLDIENLDK